MCGNEFKVKWGGELCYLLSLPASLPRAQVSWGLKALNCPLQQLWLKWLPHCYELQLGISLILSIQDPRFQKKCSCSCHTQVLLPAVSMALHPLQTHLLLRG